MITLDGAPPEYLMCQANIVQTRTGCDSPYRHVAFEESRESGALGLEKHQSNVSMSGLNNECYEKS